MSTSKIQSLRTQIDEMDQFPAAKAALRALDAAIGIAYDHARMADRDVDRAMREGSVPLDSRLGAAMIQVSRMAGEMQSLAEQAHKQLRYGVTETGA